MDKRRNPIYRNIVLAILCAILFAAFVCFLLWNRREESSERERLKKLAEQQQIEEREERATEQLTEPPTKETETVQSTEVNETESEVESETEETFVAGISCWGDEFYEPEAAEKYSYRAILEKLFKENGYEIDVADKTLFGAGTLSMMKMAGVPQSVLDTYIDKHKRQNNNSSITETGIRDLTEEEMERWEKDYVPILLMGYYGGWNNDLQELIEQEQKILDTFEQNKDNFIIVGIPPLDKTVGAAEYDTAMKEAWGEHYISTSEVTSYSQSTPEGQEEIANAIFQKLVELNYISK